jgi:sugar phosphate isomerase/epimerase
VNRIALQLYTVRDVCADDLPGALATTAGLGFEGVELHDLYGHSADEVHRLLDENGLVVCGRHATLTLVEDELESLAAELRTFGTDRLVVSWVEPPTTATEADATRDRIVAVAERARALGLRLGFHNHDGELVALEDGRTLLDRLADVPEDLLFLELDLGWVWYAGGDPLALVERMGTRAPLLHVKDMLREGGAVHVPLGEGSLDYSGFAEVVEHAGTEWLILEQDETEGPTFDAVESSIAYLKQILGSSV